jgi:hypothetical protein
MLIAQTQKSGDNQTNTSIHHALKKQSRVSEYTTTTERGVTLTT